MESRDNDKKINSAERERRQFQRTHEAAIIYYRIKSPVSVFLQYGGNEFNAVATDISQDGIGFFTGHEIPTGTVLGIRFSLLDMKASSSQDRIKSVEVTGEVRYIVFVPKEKSFRLGIHFVRLTDQDKAFITLFVQSRVRCE